MKTLNRREFLDLLTYAGAGMAAGPFVLRGAHSAGAAQPPSNSRPDVVAIYYPHWHNYDHGSAWKGEGWTEWEGVKAAIPRFPGHAQPKKPSWGHFDESDPKCVEREINLASDHGIDVFLYCWYWYSGVQNMQEALEKGFLGAPNRDRMKFALMWANHDRRDQFCPEFGKPRTVWLPCRHSPRDMARVIDYGIEHYFRQPNYWRPDGHPFFSIFEATKFIEQIGGPEKTRALFGEMDALLRRADLPPMHWGAMVAEPKAAELAKEAGFHSTSRYNIAHANKTQPDFTERYEDVMEAHRESWAKMGATSIVNLPVVTMGWDSTPRCRPDVPWPFAKKEYPYVPVVVGNTPELYEQLLRDAARLLERDPHKPFAVLLNAWNEWTEGGYLLPEERTGTAYLEAIKRTFGKRNTD
ncbi:MAG TPA: glycoside hydrolase family 99-like domain-containing protein [Verrucomicrobiae bacterium]|nr:glycoside hydrolase family 99-like domain-containing protein [Verrucomicrobiae bacterium]